MQVIRTATIIGLLLLAQAAQAQVRVPVAPSVPVMPAPITPPLISPPSLAPSLVPAPSAPPAVRGCPEAENAADCPGRSIQKNEGMGVLGPSNTR